MVLLGEATGRENSVLRCVCNFLMMPGAKLLPADACAATATTSPHDCPFALRPSVLVPCSCCGTAAQCRNHLLRRYGLRGYRTLRRDEVGDAESRPHGGGGKEVQP